MHLRAYMAALDIDDLDHMAKTAVIMVAGRANQHTAAAWVSIGRIADDMSVTYATAWRALNRAEKAGYLAVEKQHGQRSKWQLTSRAGTYPTSISDDTPDTEDLARSYIGPRALVHTKDVTRTSEGRKRARTLASRRVRASRKDETQDLTPSSARPPLRAVDSYAHYPNWTAERHTREKDQNDG